MLTLNYLLQTTKHRLAEKSIGLKYCYFIIVSEQWYPLHDSYGNPEYRTCDVGHQQPNTWLRSNLISVPNNVKKVNITIEYRTVNCTTFRTTNFCREYFDFYVHQSTTLSAPDPLQSKATYEKIAEITLPTLGINAKRHFGFQVKGKFIVLAFHNRGSCSNIHSVTVSYLVCPEITVVSGLVSLPRSVAPVTNSVPVQGSCVTNAIYNKGILSLECKSDGVWNISSLKGRCTCREDTENSGGECKGNMMTKNLAITSATIKVFAH